MNHVPIRTIIDTVAEHYGVSVEDMRGSVRRQRHLAMPRHVAMWLARRLTIMSLEAIAEALGLGDHTTVIYAERKIGRMVRGGDLDLEGLEAACISRADRVA